MTNTYRFFFLLFFLIGCTPNVIEEKKLVQKIESLNMNIFSKKGDKIYSITSPDLSYNNNKLKFELKKPIINIFKGEEIPWKEQLSWGLLVNNTSLPKPNPIISKLEYEQDL